MLFHLQLLTGNSSSSSRRRRRRREIWGAVVPDPSTGTTDVRWCARDLARFSGERRPLPKTLEAGCSTLASLLFPSEEEEEKKKERYGEQKFLAKKMVPTRVARRWTTVWESRLRTVRLADARTDVVPARGTVHPVQRLRGEVAAASKAKDGPLFWDEWLPVFLRDCGRISPIGLPPPPPPRTPTLVLEIPPCRRLPTVVPEVLVLRDGGGRTVRYRMTEDYVSLA